MRGPHFTTEHPYLWYAEGQKWKPWLDYSTMSKLLKKSFLCVICITVWEPYNQLTLPYIRWTPTTSLLPLHNNVVTRFTTDPSKVRSLNKYWKRHWQKYHWWRIWERDILRSLLCDEMERNGHLVITGEKREKEVEVGKREQLFDNLTAWLMIKNTTAALACI